MTTLRRKFPLKFEGTPPQPPMPSPSPFQLLSRCTTLLQLKSIHSRLTAAGLVVPSTFLELLLALTSLPPPHGTPLPLYASALFLHIPCPTTFPCNLLARSHLLASSPIPALHVLLAMRRSSIPPDSHTYPLAAKACASLGPEFASLGRGLHAQALAFGFHGDVFVSNSMISMYANLGLLAYARKVFHEGPWRDIVSHNALIDMYVKCGEIGMAREVFDRMPLRSMVSFGTLISGYSRYGTLEQALELFDRMVEGGMQPDVVALISVLSACARWGELGVGRRIHGYIRSCGIEMNAFLVTALVDMYLKCGYTDAAVDVFESSSGHRNLFAWNAIIVGLATNGHGKLSLEYFSRMQEAGVRADGITLLGVLMGCSHAGLVGVARKLFDEMEEVYNVARELKHYGCMSDMLGRAGLIREAAEMIRRMPVAGDMHVWGGLLGGCRIHCNVKVAEVAVRHLLVLNPGDSGVYSVMANIYANAGRWEDAARIRKFLSHSSIVRKRSTGCSALHRLP